MLQSKGLSSRATEEDHERTRRLADAEMTIHQLEGLLEQKDKEVLQLREVCVISMAWTFGNNIQYLSNITNNHVGTSYPE